MYEFHGWATIRESPVDVDEGNLRKIANNIQDHVRQLNWVSGSIELKWINGIPMFNVAGKTNHRSQDADELFETYELIAKTAPGSYGVLFIWNDEDKNGYDNEFRVFVLARGKVVENIDPFLSPCVPMIEDPYVETDE
jgi:hypothetical protein